MADKDVITAMELCANISQDGCMMLCPYKDDQDETYPGLCEHIMKQDAFELLKRQQAEIERLKEQQPKKGKWNDKQAGFCGNCYARCSVCNQWNAGYTKETIGGNEYLFYPFCRYCGADMRGEQE